MCISCCALACHGLNPLLEKGACCCVLLLLLMYIRCAAQELCLELCSLQLSGQLSPLQVFDIAHIAWRLRVACELNEAIEQMDEVALDGGMSEPLAWFARCVLLIVLAWHARPAGAAAWRHGRHAVTCTSVQPGTLDHNQHIVRCKPWTARQSWATHQLGDGHLIPAPTPSATSHRSMPSAWRLASQLMWCLKHKPEVSTQCAASCASCLPWIGSAARWDSRCRPAAHATDGPKLSLALIICTLALSHRGGRVCGTNRAYVCNPVCARPLRL